MDNDKRVEITLKCNVIPINIFLSEDTVNFAPTFIGMSDRKIIHIVNNSEHSTLFEWLPCEQNLAAHPSLKHVEIFPMSGELHSGTATAIDLTFKPEDSEDDEFELIKDVAISMRLQLSAVPHYHPSVNIKGLILGPSFEHDKLSIDMKEMFTGECHNIEVTVKNTGIIGGKILFVNPSSVHLRVSSNCEFLKPNESKCFKMEFLAVKIGRFAETIYFKVQNGERLSLTLQGVVKPLEISIEPKTICLLPSAICVPQMQVLKLTNKHPFDMNVLVECEGNGCDDPLEFLEFFNYKSSIYMRGENAEEISQKRASIKSFIESSKLLESIAVAKDGIVMNFNNIEREAIVSSVLQKLIDNGIEKHLISEAIVERLIEDINENDFVKYSEKDWIFPNNPRQIDCNKKTFTISGNSSDELKIFLTPNFIGKYSRNLFFTLSKDGSNHEKSIKTMQLSFECQGAVITIHNQSSEITSYVESVVNLKILIENVSTTDGFFFLNLHKDMQMEIKSSDEKFHIAAGSKKVISLHVTPLMPGQILKHVEIVALGSNRKFPVFIECKSLPPEVVVRPNKIMLNDLDILQQHDTRIFIENRSQTKARFFLKFENERECYDINPRGGILSSKQCVMVMLEKFFHDPGDYSDVLIVEVVNSKVIKIPIKSTVRKLPIIIEPSFSSVIDFGSLFVSKTPHFLDYKLTNRGKNA